MYKLEEVQKYLAEILDANRIKYLHEMISNPHLRVNSEDKKWVAYTTQASENQTVINAIKEILADHKILWQTIKDDAIEAIDKTGQMFESSNIKMKHRIPFYVLVLDQIIE
jgi:predicted transcriptional regulator